MSTTCAACGQPVASSAAFCLNCGQPLPRRCLQCGAAIGATDKWCAECGAKVVAAAPKGVPAPPPSLEPTPVPPALTQALPNSEPVPGIAAPAPVFAGPAPALGAHSRRRPIPPIALALVVVAVLAVGALGTGIVKLPGGTTTAPVGSPPPIDNLATPAEGQLTLGNASTVKAIKLDAKGVSTMVSAPGKSWDGLGIDVAAGSWPGSTLKITAAPITASSFGELVTPISPLYTVSGAEGMAPTPVTLKIPASIPDDSFAMGFFYDASGHLEGMPLLAEDGTSITVATQHFSSFFASLIKRSLLPVTIDSGFRPGKDDWQFVNNGSYVATNGQCAGQVLTEAWYFIERHQKAKASSLNGLFDNNGSDKTPYLWQDDSNGYRLAGVAHTQYAANSGPGTADAFFKSWRTAGFDSLEYDAFRYSIAVTGEPQLISISDANDRNGHAMLIYRVTPGDLLVADPNFPGEWRRIAFDAVKGKLGPYASGVSRAEIEKGHATTYTNFGYKAKTALVDWAALAADWAAFDAGTIGNGVFPAYSIEVSTGEDDQGDPVWAPLVDGYRTSDKSLGIRLVDPNHAGVAMMDIYRGTSSEPTKQNMEVAWLDLSEGDNPLGFYIQGAKPNEPLGFVDFVRLNVVYEAGASQAPSAAAAGGHWVLTSATPKGGPNASSYTKPDEKYAIVSSNGQITFFYNYDGPPHRHEEASVSWGPPPASAAPGDVWKSTLTAQGTCSFDIDEQGWGVGVDVWAFWTAGGEKQSKQFAASADCQHGSGSTELSWAFPAHDQASGDTLEIDVTGGEEHGGDSWTYSYEWKP